MTGGQRRAVIWRNEVLGNSETFIANQVGALRSWRASYAGRARVSNQFGVEPAVVAPTLEEPELRDLLGTADLVHAHFAQDAVAISPVAARAGVPLVVTFHGYDVTVRHLWWRPRDRRRLREMFRQATTLIAVSEFIADRLRRLGAPEDKIVVHHIGIPIPADPGEGDGRRGVLFVGRLVEKKGADDLLAALAALPPDLRSVPVSIIGDGPRRRALEARARSAELDVTFHGALPHEQVTAHMRRAAVLCCPSKRARNGDSEGLPIAVLEAAAHRVPIVATRASGIPEAIVDGESGLLVGERDTGALSRCLETVLRDEARGRRLAARGRERVEQMFDVVRQTAELEALYDRAVRTATVP